MPIASWKPSKFIENTGDIIGSSTLPAVILTDAGAGFLKAIGNPEGEHALAKEFVGSQLAAEFGLPTFDFNLMTIEDTDDIPLADRRKALPGPAFISRKADGNTWGGTEGELKRLTNRDVIGQLVVFDTWTRNCDRYNADPCNRRSKYDNVFLETRKRSTRLVVYDHTCCFTCGKDLSIKELGIAATRDDRIFGLFPSFVKFVKKDQVEVAVAQLKKFKRAQIKAIIDSVPKEWCVSDQTKVALSEFLFARASYVAGCVEDLIAAECGKLFLS